MGDKLDIQYLTRRQIEKQKWDACIDKADNGLIYAYSFYLDCMAAQWDGLILNDYEAVMPLTWNRKYGINYLHQPFLTAQLGVFGNKISEQQVGDFIQSIPFSFRYIDISLNSGNISGAPTGFSIHRSNYVLRLNKSYEDIYQNYRDNIKRNIRKAVQAGCAVQKDFDVEKVIELAIQQMQDHDKDAVDNVNRFRKLYHYLHDKQMAVTYGISLNNELLASCVFFFSHNRAYYILVGRCSIKSN